MPTDRNFALRLMLAQEARGLTQTQLASAVGTNKSVICALLQGKCHPSYETLLELTKVLKVSADYLLGLRGEAKITLTSKEE